MNSNKRAHMKILERIYRHKRRINKCCDSVGRSIIGQSRCSDAGSNPAHSTIIFINGRREVVYSSG